MSLTTKPKACEKCPAYEWGVGFVPPENLTTHRFALVGQGPGETEALTSRPFHPR